MLEIARALLHTATRIQIISHLSPDGDAIGSLLGLSWALRAVGKETVPTCIDGCPDTFKFLPGAETIVKKIGEPCDLVIFVDCADQARAGKPGEQIVGQPQLNFDHHITNPGFAQLNFVDASMTATAELITRLLPGLGSTATTSRA